MPIQMDRIDHVVLNVANIDETISFYSRVLGMKAETFGQGRKCLVFGKQKINLHLKGAPFEPHALAPTAGSMDLCLISTTPLAAVIEHLKKQHVAIEKGPVKRVGSGGLITSVYIRDLDGNLLEISNYG